MRCVWVAIVLALSPACAWAQADTGFPSISPIVRAEGGDANVAGATVAITGRAANIRAAGGTVDISANAEQSVWAAGADIRIDGLVRDGLHAIGGSVTARGRVSGDASLSGASLNLDLPIAGKLNVFGGNITVGPASAIGGPLSLAGAMVRFSGRAAAPARIAAGSIYFDGRADVGLTLVAANVVIGPNAQISGGLRILSGRPATIDPAARITGAVEQGLAGIWSNIPAWLWSGMIAAFMAAAALMTGLLLILLAGGVTLGAGTIARQRPLTSFLIGLASTVVLPVVALVLVLTVVGAPIGLALLLGLPLLLLVGHATAAVGLAALFFAWRERPIGTGRALIFLLIGAAGITALGLIPVAGPWLVTVMLLIGLGGFLRAFARRLRLGELELP